MIDITLSTNLVTFKLPLKVLELDYLSTTKSTYICKKAKDPPIKSSQIFKILQPSVDFL